MNICLRHRCGLVVLAAVILLQQSLSAAVPNMDWNVTVLDKILTNVPAGQTIAQVGDMGIQVSLLQYWRNQQAGVPQPKLAFDGTAPTWTSGNVYYTFSNNVSALKQKAFLDCCAEWSTFANVHFIPRTSQANYVLVYEDAGLGGGESTVGMVGGEQFLEIGPTAWNHATICHELGHTLGLIHEQSRSDRDTYVTILTQNIAAGEEGNFVKLTNSKNKTAYDFLSVMEYARNAFSVSPSLDTIEPLPAYTNFINLMGVQFDPVLSPGDRAGVASVYGAGPTLTNIVTNTQDSGPGSLRAALYYAFDHPGTTISFNIPTSDAGFSNNVFNIFPSDALPSLVHATTLDGSTEPTHANPNGPQVLLNGSLGQQLDVFPSGLQFKGTNCVARSFIIQNFPENGILFAGNQTRGNTVSGCYVGTDANGMFTVSNSLYQVEISGGAVSNVVGGTTVAARNIIGGGPYQGVAIHDAGTRNNVIEGNYIGVNAQGNAALPNGYAGVQIFNGAQSNLIGGNTASARNIISGNALQGIYISGAGTVGNIIAGNYLGLDPTGTAAMPNGYSGVEIGSGAQNNIVGAGNVISGNAENGVLFNGTASNSVQGNYIGLNATGSAAVPNGWAGVDFYLNAQSNTAISNVISGNANDGIIFYEAGAANNVVQGNIIGLNPAGTAIIGNAWAGVDFYYGPNNNLVGGNTAAARNVISGNGNDGVILSGANTIANTVAGNVIGLNAAGTTAAANGGSGVDIYNGAAANLIGGYGGARNFISGNNGYGIFIGYGSSNNIVQGNSIGLDVSNAANFPNTGCAVLLYTDAVGNLIGGVTPGAANLISGSTADGIQVVYGGSTNNTIRGNSIFNSTYSAIGLYNGGNNSLAAPAISSATVTTNTVVSGTYNGAAGKIFLLDFYADASPAASAESQTYLGTLAVTGTGTGAAFTANLGAHLPPGRAITATATDATGNTSALSTGKAVTLTSGVNDGIPNAWRALYFGGSGTTTNATSTANADPDHDGVSNYQEFLAGTNPTNAASVFILTALNPATSTNVVSLNSVSGTVYRVQYRNDLSSGAWAILADQVIGNGTNLFLPDPGASALSQRFYRAQILW